MLMFIAREAKLFQTSEIFGLQFLQLLSVIKAEASSDQDISNHICSRKYKVSLQMSNVNLTGLRKLY